MIRSKELINGQGCGRGGPPPPPPPPPPQPVPFGYFQTDTELRREYIERKIGLILLKKLSEGYQCRGSSVVERMPEEHGVASSILARGKKFI